MDVRIESAWQESRPTLGELCEAIAEGRVGYKERYGYVELTALDVRRLAREDRVLGKHIAPSLGLHEDSESHSGSFA